MRKGDLGIKKYGVDDAEMPMKLHQHSLGRFTKEIW